MKKKREKVTGLYALLVMAVAFICMSGFVTTEVKAADSYSYIECTWDEINKEVDKVSPTAYSCVVIDSTTTSWETGWYVVTGDVTIGSRVCVTGEVNLILTNGATLTASAGINVTSGNTLNIYAQSDVEGTMGELVVTGGSWESGIGGGNYESVGTIIIHGGTVNVTGGAWGAGIGGGNGGSGGTTIIYGGEITATGGRGAGIGGGEGGSGGTITIYGGEITASSANWGAGIGGGNSGSSGDVMIMGGTVNATGSHYGAGIGSSNDGFGGTITIVGGTVTATGGTWQPGIGNVDAITALVDTNNNYGNYTSGMIISGDTINVTKHHLLNIDYTIPEDMTVNIPLGASLRIMEDVALVNNGTIKVGDITYEGSLDAGTVICLAGITEASVLIGTDLTMNYIIQLYDASLVGDGQKLAVQFSMNGVTSTVDAAGSDRSYTCSFEGIAPKCMADTINAKLVVVDSETESVANTLYELDYSVKEYADALIKREGAESKAGKLAKAMLNYGAYAEKYLDGYTSIQTSTPSVTVTKDMYEQYKATVNGSSANIVYLGSTLRLESKIMIRHYFELAENVAELPAGVNLTSYEDQDGVYYYESNGISAANMGTVNTCTVDGLTINYSPMSYVVTVLANVSQNAANAQELVDDTLLQDLVKALYNYYKAAAEYNVN